MVELLLESGANANLRDKFYRASPLTWAVIRKHPAIVELLIAHGANDVDTALASAIGMKQLEMVQVILRSKKVSDQGLASALQTAKLVKDESAIKVMEESMTEEALKLFEKAESERIEREKLSEYVGTYQSEGGTKLQLKFADGKLQAIQSDSDQPLTLSSNEMDSLVASDIAIRFSRDDGKIKSLSWKVGELETTYVRQADESAGAGSVPLADAPTVSLGDDFPLTSQHWPNFRGTLSRGVNDGQVIATNWNGADGTNIAWKTEIPGLGTSSPIVWGDRVYVTTAVQEADSKGFRTGPYGDVESVLADGECSYQLLCLDLSTGNVHWNQEAVREIPRVKRHAKSSHANPTPATDGTHVIALFGGAGLYCYDMQGELLWSRQLGMLDSGWFYDRSYQWGFGSSPIIFEDMVIVQCDVQEGAFLVALDITSGNERWKTNRDEIPTWSSPVAFVAKDGTPTVIVTGTKCTAAYEARTGELLWKLGGFSEIVVPTPQITPDLALLSSGYAPVQPVVALSHAARGELQLPKDNEAKAPFAWAQMRGGPYMPTPLIANNKLYILDNGGLLTCLALESGKRLFRQRLRNEKANAFTSSVVASNGNLYCTSEEGQTFVVAMDDQGTVVSQNELGEAVLTTMAIANGTILARGEKHLFAIRASSK